MPAAEQRYRQFELIVRQTASPKKSASIASFGLEAMRQGFLAGLVVLVFGLPMALFADGKELVRECAALGDAAGGNTTSFKAIWLSGSKTVAVAVPKTDELAVIQRWGAWQLAEKRKHPETIRSVASGYGPMPSQAGMTIVNGFSFVSDRFDATAVAALAPLASDDTDSVIDAASGGSRFSAFVDAFSIAAYADEMKPAAAPPDAGAGHPIALAMADIADDSRSAPGMAFVTDSAADIAATTGGIKDAAPADASGFADVGEKPQRNTGFSDTAPIGGTMSGLIDIGLNSN